MRALTVLMLCVATVMVWPATSHAQLFTLPKVDKVNIFVQSHRLALGNDLHQTGTADVGWGIETAFVLTTIESRAVHLAVGYDQVNMRGTLSRSNGAAAYDVRGTIKDLPSVSVYVALTDLLYSGIGTGFTSFSNTFAYDGKIRAFNIVGDTFDLSAKLGVEPSISDQVSVFAELGYHFRYLGGAFYDKVPMALEIQAPRSLYFGGFTLAVGVEVNLTTDSSLSQRLQKEALRRAAETGATAPAGSHYDRVCSLSERLGWLEIDEEWDPVACSGSATQTFNVRVMIDPASVVPGGQIEVCASSVQPKGWTIVAQRRSETRCKLTAAPASNVLMLRRPD